MDLYYLCSPSLTIKLISLAKSRKVDLCFSFWSLIMLFFFEGSLIMLTKWDLSWE